MHFSILKLAQVGVVCAPVMIIASAIITISVKTMGVQRCFQGVRPTWSSLQKALLIILIRLNPLYWSTAIMAN